MLAVRLAWRNLWRKRKRTFITVSAVVFAVIFSILIDSLQKGAWDNLIGNIVNYYYGHAQLQNKGYWDNPSIDEAFPFSHEQGQLISNHNNVNNYIPRLESFALAASGNKSHGVMVVGTDPYSENAVTGLKSRVTQGQYFISDNEGLLMTAGVGSTMDLTVGDTLVLISQGYHGVNAAGKYPITGIVNLGPPELNNRMIYMPLKLAQEFFGADSLVTSVALSLGNTERLDQTLTALRSSFSVDNYDIKNWMELMPDLVQAKELDRASSYVVYFILYTVISFGIFATILMMIKERQYEIGVMLSVGMNRLRLSLSIWFEILFIGLMGVVIGSVVAFPVITYFKFHPIRLDSMAEIYEKFGFEPYLPAAVDLQIFLTQAIIVFLLSVLISIYPISTIMKLNIIKALKG